MRNRGEDLVLSTKDGRVVGKIKIDSEIEMLFEEGFNFILAANVFRTGTEKRVFDIMILPVEEKDTGVL